MLNIENKCPKCGKFIHLPEGGEVRFCPYCGAEVGHDDPGQPVRTELTTNDGTGSNTGVCKSEAGTVLCPQCGANLAEDRRCGSRIYCSECKKVFEIPNHNAKSVGVEQWEGDLERLEHKIYRAFFIYMGVTIALIITFILLKWMVLFFILLAIVTPINMYCMHVHELWKKFKADGLNRKEEDFTENQKEFVAFIQKSVQVVERVFSGILDMFNQDEKQQPQEEESRKVVEGKIVVVKQEGLFLKTMNVGCGCFFVLLILMIVGAIMFYFDFIR